jgi:Predicted hydrolases or acyltransferases (alpha/beta hydrolase superfamily)
MRLLTLILILFSVACSSTPKSDKKNVVTKGYDAMLSAYPYPFAVKYHEFNGQDQNLRMAYMDINPNGGAKNTIVLLHGKNFSGFYFENLTKDLIAAGYRVVIPDQIGFGKSTKPQTFQYSFHTLARYTADLLTSLDVQKFTVVGHSMGGMLATRLTLMYPERVSKMILVNPIGLEDYKVLTGYKTVEELYGTELLNNEDKIREYQKVSYYDGIWKPEYETLIAPAVGWTEGPDKNLIAKTAALTSDMVYTQPVVYEFSQIKVPTVLIIGQRDRTAIGKPWAPPENQKKMGNYPKLGRDTAKRIPKAKLIEMQGLGHVPFIEDYPSFKNTFFKVL